MRSDGADRPLIFWEKDAGREIARVNCEFENNTLVFVPDSSTTAVFCTNGDSTRRYDLKMLDAPSVIVRQTDGNINSIAIAPSGDSVVAVDSIGSITPWGVATSAPEVCVSNPKRHLQSVEFSPDGKLIAVAGENANQEPVVELRDAGAGQIIATLKGNHRDVNSVAI